MKFKSIIFKILNMKHEYKKIENEEFEGERPLYNSKNLILNKVKFNFGESPLKESSNIILNDSIFTYKYPIWYSNNVEINNSTFQEMSRSGIWYSNNITLKKCIVDCPKLFRYSKNIKIYDTSFNKGDEFFWKCKGILISNVNAKGDYMFMNSSNIKVKNFNLDGNYVFDGSKNVIVENAYLNSKDSFWNTKNVIVKNSTIIGEYIGWNSENLTFINCKIDSIQAFCYVKNLKLINCTLINTNLAFEYTSVKAKINSKIDSIKNPLKGHIEALEIGEIVIDNNYKRKGKLKIIEKVNINEKI